MKLKGFTKSTIEIDESMREIATLEELYTELTSSSPEEDKELATRKDEAKFARERMLRLSLHVKNLLEKMESSEKLD